MKIIVIPNEPNPNMSGRHYGVAKSLVAAGHEVHTVVWDLPQLQHGPELLTHLYRSFQTRTYPYKKLTLHKFSRLPFFWPGINGWLFRHQLRRLHRSLGADIIFAESYTNETAVPKDLPFIYDLADDYAAPAQVFGSLAYKIMFAVLGVQRTMRYHCENALAVTAVSDILCAYAQQYNKHVVKLPNGVESDLIASIMAAKKPKPHPHSMVYVSGFGPWSRPIELMEATVRLRHDFPDISLTMIGEGTEVSKIEQFIAEHDAANFIHYEGFISDRRTVFELINQHAIGLNISEKNIWRDAAHPMKVIEYSALGKIVVSTDLAGVKTLKLPNVFMFSDTNKKRSLEYTLRAALTIKLPAAISRKVSKEILHDYDWQYIAGQLVDILTSSLNRHRSPAIVHITPSFPPKLGGLEKVVQVLAQTQHDMGRQVSVITSDQDAKGYTQLEAYTVTRLPSFIVANTTIMPRLCTELLRIQKESIVHVHITQAFTPEMVLIASHIKRFRFIAHIHLDVPASGQFGFLLELYKSVFLRRVLHRAEKVVVPTLDYKELILNKYHVEDQNIIIVPNGTDYTILEEPRPLPTHRLRFLYVGRLSSQKNIPLLIAAMEYYAALYGGNFDLKIVGDGELRDSLESLVNKIGLAKHIHFLGARSGKSLENIYTDSDIFLLTSVAESFGLVLIEAMTKGLPIVSTAIPAVRNVIGNKKNGLLTEQKPEDFANAINLLASHKQLYEQISANNLKASALYGWDKINNTILKIYNEIS